MPWTKEHLTWLKDTGDRLITSDGKEIEVWEFQYEKNDTILSAWARHFRNHYCSDLDIDDLIEGTEFEKSEKPRRDYLVNIKFPDSSNPPGPSIRSGDFAEILISDFVEYVLNFWVPRTRFCNKNSRNESTKGVDVIGFKFHKDGQVSPEDKLLFFESKAKLTNMGLLEENYLQKAIKDSGKDHEIRKAETLNALKQWFREKGERDFVDRIKRFQNEEDRPYIRLSGASALLSTDVYNSHSFSTTNCSEHSNKHQLTLLVIKGDNLMDVVHELYRRAADEA